MVYYEGYISELRPDRPEWGYVRMLLEVGDDRNPVRQLELYDCGPALRYDRVQPQDDFGCLVEVPFPDSNTAWADWVEITAAVFEAAWAGNRG